MIDSETGEIGIVMPDNDQQAESGQQDQQEQQNDQDRNDQDQNKPEESVEYWRAKAREHERRNRKLASAAKRLDELEEAQKTEEQKQADRVAKAEQRAVEAEGAASRFRVAARFGVSEEDAELFLTANDEATQIKQAERLQQRDAAQQPKQQRGWRSGEGSGQRQGDPDAAFAEQLFGKTS